MTAEEAMEKALRAMDAGPVHGHRTVARALLEARAGAWGQAGVAVGGPLDGPQASLRKYILRREKQCRDEINRLEKL